MDIDDYNLVIDLWKNTEGIGLSDADSKDNIRMYLQRNPRLSLVAMKGRELVGAVLCGHDGRRGFLHHLAVRKDQRLNGIGKCHMFVFRENEQGIEFWRKNGWQIRLDLKVMSRDTK
ncbi:MAG: GNAT family N-acetyltransferase [Desulfitobacterium sp.]